MCVFIYKMSGEKKEEQGKKAKAENILNLWITPII